MIWEVPKDPGAKMNAKLGANIHVDECDGSELLNPFVHHLELETTAEKIKVQNPEIFLLLSII